MFFELLKVFLDRSCAPFWISFRFRKLSIYSTIESKYDLKYRFLFDAKTLEFKDQSGEDLDVNLFFTANLDVYYFMIKKFKSLKTLIDLEKDWKVSKKFEKVQGIVLQIPGSSY